VSKLGAKKVGKKGSARRAKPRARRSLADVLAAVVEPKRLPAVLVERDLPRLVGASGPLEREVQEDVLRAIVEGKLGQEPLLGTLRDAVTPESRDELALALLRFWEEKEFHGRYEWVLDAVVALGGDRSTIALARHMAAWPSRSDTGRRRTIRAIPALLDAGTDTAILALLGLRQTAVVPSVLEAVIDAIDRAVEARGTSLSELFDEITPSLGLDAQGRRVFDYGGRTFTAAFDDHFEPRLHDAAGHVLDDLPPAAPGDDPERVAVAKGTWSTLAAQLREAVDVQTFRLEQDMVAGRRWDAATWSRCLKEHPLLVSFTRRLLWGCYDASGELLGTFRTAEDKSLVGLHDEIVELRPKALVGLVHPLQLDDATRAAWATHFGDYEIIQPFPQLGRALHVVGGDEAASTATTRFAKTRFKSGVLRDVLVRRGWERDPDYFRQFYQRTFARDGVVAVAVMSPGVAAGAASYDVADQTISTLEFRKRTGRGKSREPVVLAEVPSIAFSEAVLDLSEVLVEQDAC
jgi:hypothetical protein